MGFEHPAPAKKYLGVIWKQLQVFFIMNIGSCEASHGNW